MPFIKIKLINTLDIKLFFIARTSEQVNTTDSCLFVPGKGSRKYIRALRLWLQPWPPNEQPTPQQIGYFDVVPRVQTHTFSRDEVLDRLDTILDQTNRMLASNPLSGKIITIETDTVKIGQDTNDTYWCEEGWSNPQFIYRLRIFYILGPPAFETVGIADFTPVQQASETFEPFHSVLAKAHTWVKAQPPELRILNAQTILYRTKGDIDTLKMIYNEGDTYMYFIKYLRIAYTITHGPQTSTNASK